MAEKEQEKKLGELRADYQRLIAGGWGTSLSTSIRDRIRKDLNELILPLTALDATGQLQEKDIEENMAAGIRLSCLKYAQERYEDFCAGDRPSISGPAAEIESIAGYLNEAEGKIEDLDATGQSSEAEIKKKISAAWRQDHILHARSLFDGLVQTGTYSPDFMERNAQAITQKHLDEIGAGLAALDPTGQASDAGMAAEMAARQKQGYLAGARHELKGLKEIAGRGKPAYPESLVARAVDHIHAYLAKGGHCLADMDADGEKTDADMAAEIKEAERAIHLGRAQEEYEKILKEAPFRDTPADVEAFMRQPIMSLQLAEGKLSDLDPTGVDSEAVITQKLEKRHKELHQQAAVRQFTHLQGGRFETRDEIDEEVRHIRTHFAEASCDARILDARGTRTAAEMEKELRKAALAAMDRYVRAHPEEGFQTIPKVRFRSRAKPPATRPPAQA